jgi:hypothetical protein
VACLLILLLKWLKTVVPNAPLQASPFLEHNNWESGFVDDEDRVALNTLE